jgi:hypothetical protein
MKWLMITAFAAVTLAAATTVMWSHPPVAHQTASMTSEELRTPATRAPLPVEVLDDMTFVDPPATKK